MAAPHVQGAKVYIRRLPLGDNEASQIVAEFQMAWPETKGRTKGPGQADPSWRPLGPVETHEISRWVLTRESRAARHHCPDIPEAEGRSGGPLASYGTDCPRGLKCVGTYHVTELLVLRVGEEHVSMSGAATMSRPTACAMPAQSVNSNR